MTEREKIVAMIGREIERTSIEAEGFASVEAKCFALGQATGMEIIMGMIEGREHLRRSEPTIPASEWIPKSNLTY